MIKARNLVKGDKVAIVSLSSGIFGEEFCSHEVEIAKKRLEDYGFEVVFMPHTLAGAKYVSEHPEDRAADLKQAILDPEIKAIITAIGGDDTYRTIPYLMDDLEFVEGVKNNPKIFSGFSDTTINHLMFYKLGLKTFYGPCAMIDLAELDNDMLPYTKEHFEMFIGSKIDMGLYKAVDGAKVITGDLISFDDGVIKVSTQKGEFAIKQAETTFVRLSLEGIF